MMALKATSCCSHRLDQKIFHQIREEVVVLCNTIIMLSIIVPFMRYGWRMMGLLAWSFSYSFVLPGINSRSWGLPLSPHSIGDITPTLCVWRSWYLIEFLYHTQPGRAPLDRSVDAFYIVHWSALPTPTHLSPNMLPIDDIQLSEQDHLLCCEMTMRKESASLPML